jgi:hypothetical protein
LLATVKEAELLEKEFAYGKFERVLTLPEGVNGEKLVAEYVHGVLEFSAPVAAERDATKNRNPDDAASKANRCVKRQYEKARSALCAFPIFVGRCSSQPRQRSP